MLSLTKRFIISEHVEQKNNVMIDLSNKQNKWIKYQTNRLITHNLLENNKHVKAKKNIIESNEFFKY